MIEDFSKAVKAGWHDARTVAELLGNRAGAALFGSRDCLLCLDNAGMRALCGSCERLMPRAGMACPACARPLPVRGLCGRCVRRPGPVDGIVAAFEYRFPLDRLVHRFKFGGDLALGAFLGSSLAQSVAASARPDLVLPSPASSARLRERGFNPAAVLARRVARELGVPWHPGLLRKVKHTPPQTGLPRAARRRNLRSAFQSDEVKGLRVAVVDDVTTTGATLEALARELRKAGALRVEGWVVARTPPPGEAS